MQNVKRRVEALETFVMDRPGLFDSPAANKMIDEICTCSGTTVAELVAHYGGEIEFLVAIHDIISKEQERRRVKH